MWTAIIIGVSVFAVCAVVFALGAVAGNLWNEAVRSSSDLPGCGR